MKKSELDGIVNDVIREEMQQLNQSIQELNTSDISGTEKLASIMVKAITQAIESSARSTAKIIERTGLIQFDD